VNSITTFFNRHFSGSAAYAPEAARAGKSGLSPEFIDSYGLSSRQVDVTGALLSGKSDREIAALLNIGINTVKTHIKSIYRKTGARGRYALMALAGGSNK
jgi:DNA-binding NarL/FixJ family response regulator